MNGTRHWKWLVPVTCAVLAMVHTWPLALDPVHLSRNDNGDAQLNEWILAWIAHQLPRVPARLFDANIFYPARDTLAFSEPLIIPALMGAPVAWLGGSPVLVFNLVLLVGFMLTAWATAALVQDWTGDRLAGLLAGSLFAFNTHTLTRLAHVQAMHAWGLPLALLSLDRLIRQRRRRDALWLAAWLSAMAYTSGYLAVFCAVLVGVMLLVRLPAWWPDRRQMAAGLALAAVVTVVVTLPVTIPYRRVARDQGMVRSLESVQEFSATPAGYLASAGRLHMATWSRSFFRDPVDAFFPGFAALTLAGVAVVASSRRPAAASDRHRNGRVWALVALAAVGVVLSLGLSTPVYGWAYTLFPPMQGLRAAARFGNLFLLAIAVLAGLGLASLRSRLSARAALWVAVAAIAAVNLEALRAPFTYRPFDGIPPIYGLLATEPDPVVLAEAPFYPPQAVFENAPYVLGSTAHWKPLMNGYSGYTPATYREYAKAFWFFPEDFAIEAMRQAGVTHVLMHPARFHEDAARALAQAKRSPHLEIRAVGRGGDVLFKMR